MSLKKRDAVISYLLEASDEDERTINGLKMEITALKARLAKYEASDGGPSVNPTLKNPEKK